MKSGKLVIFRSAAHWYLKTDASKFRQVDFPPELQWRPIHIMNMLHDYSICEIFIQNVTEKCEWELCSARIDYLWLVWSFSYHGKWNFFK